MATVKVSELKAGPALDWAVAKAIGKPVELTMKFASKTDGTQSSGLVCWVPDARRPFNPSTDWAQGGPLIDANIEQLSKRSDSWTALIPLNGDDGFFLRDLTVEGLTALEAACKCIVASVFTEVVEIPDELGVAGEWQQ